MSIPVLRPAIAYIDPMDRSTSRVISTNVMPIAIVPKSEIWRPTFNRF
jgi:hypothetical protein